MNSRRNRIGSNQYKIKKHKHVGLHLLLFILVMNILMGLYLFNIPPNDVISPVGQARADEIVVLPIPTATPTPVDNSDEQKEIEDYIKTIFPRNWKMAIQVQHHECSPQHRLYPKCIKNDEVEYSCSIWQINLRYHAPKVPGGTLEEKCDNLVNDYKLATLIAHKIYSDSDGFWPWTWYKKAGYLLDK